MDVGRGQSEAALTAEEIAQASAGALYRGRIPEDGEFATWVRVRAEGRDGLLCVSSSNRELVGEYVSIEGVRALRSYVLKPWLPFAAVAGTPAAREGPDVERLREALRAAFGWPRLPSPLDQSEA